MKTPIQKYKYQKNMKLNKPMKTILPLAAFAGLAVTANAAVIITPTGVTSTTQLGGYEIVKSINSSGLSGGGTSGDILSETNDNGGTQWLSGTAVASEVVTFDLGGTFNVDGVHLWNWVFTNNTSTKWGVDEMDISFSSDGVNFGNTATVSFDPDIALNGPSSAQTRTFSIQSGVTHIQLDSIKSFDMSRVGFGEIRFSEAVPEPSTTALLGLGGLALILRRRK
tara:strand:+ start:3466 stop:4137 length:672 start_codon:yes stop_codon:yes gene_type:complete